MDTNPFAGWLERQVAERGWSFRELGRRAGLSSGAVSAVMTGRSPAGWDLCRGVAQALEVPPEAIFRLAGLLPPLPPPVEEEREALAILRRLPAAKRRDVLTMLRALASGESATAPPPVPQPTTSPLPDPSPPIPVDEEELEQQLLDEFRQLPEAWQFEALREVERLQRYRTLNVHIIGDEEEDEPDLLTREQGRSEGRPGLEGEAADDRQSERAAKAA